MDGDVCAFVGAAGGAGTTRLTLECATCLAREGHDVAVLDAAYGTQGLADRTPGRIEPDVTALCLGDDPLEAGLVDLDVEGAGRLAVCPARAPFERFTRAMTAEAAEAFGDLVAEATRAFEYVLVDAPPLASNPAVAAVTAADRVAVVCDAARADEAVPRTVDRLVDVGVDAENTVTVLTRTDEHPDADVAVPTFETPRPAFEGDDDARRVLADVLAATVGAEVTREDDGDGLRSRLPV